MGLKPEIREFLHQNSLERFLSYIQIHTTSRDATSDKTPSTQCQFDLARKLEKELKELHLSNVEVDDNCYVYAVLPSNVKQKCETIGFLAHIDTSESVSGENVKPIIHRNYDGSIIKFPLDSDLTIDPKEVPELQIAVGENIITASGDTLLGADDKAGIAEIMAALSAFKKFPELPHGEIRICFNPDEEVGGGMAKVKTEKLGKYCYTIDGGKPGELETECFDAYMASYKFKGLNVHPGYAKDKMINAVNIVGRYLADLPEYEAPEHTSGREGFFHPMEVNGNTELCTFRMIIRDFQNSRNLKRIDFLKKLNDTYEIRYSGLKIEMEIKHQYENMLEVLNKYPEVEGKARQALEMTGLTLSKTAIRGGTDGSRLCQMGIPTPNLFAGGILIHSKKEFILESSLWKSAETIIHLAELWTN